MVGGAGAGNKTKPFRRCSLCLEETEQAHHEDPRAEVPGWVELDPGLGPAGTASVLPAEKKCLTSRERRVTT